MCVCLRVILLFTRVSRQSAQDQVTPSTARISPVAHAPGGGARPHAQVACPQMCFNSYVIILIVLGKNSTSYL